MRPQAVPYPFQREGTDLDKALPHESKIYSQFSHLYDRIFTNVFYPRIERVIQPKEGRLVLFPSYMWHGTIPFSSGERLTAPFDVVPMGASQ